MSSEEKQTVGFEISGGRVPYQGVAVIDSLDDDGEQILSVVNFGRPSSSTKIGLLQAALDREREVLRRAWG